MSSTGPAIRAVCRILNGNSCGSGAVVGHRGDHSFVMTNAHVATANVGHRVRIEHEQSGDSRTGTVVRGAYSNQVSADWSLLRCDRIDVEPVPLSKDPWPRDVSAYTKGFPRCRPHAGTDIAQNRVLNNGTVLWLPDAISGQSGSSVWRDDMEVAVAILTWSMSYGRKRYGGGQLTSEIYRQNRVFKQTGALTGYPKMKGLIELPGEDGDYENPVLADDLVEGIFSEPVERGIADDYPEIWYTPNNGPDPEPDDPSVPPSDPGRIRTFLIEQYRAQAEFWEGQVQALQDAELHDPPPVVEDDDNEPGSLFGL